MSTTTYVLRVYRGRGHGDSNRFVVDNMETLFDVGDRGEKPPDDDSQSPAYSYNASLTVSAEGAK